MDKNIAFTSNYFKTVKVNLLFCLEIVKQQLD